MPRSFYDSLNTQSRIRERSEKNGDIYLDTYSGWYNVREETFVTETEAKEMDYKDPVSGKPLKQMEEESFFFRQSKYQARLIEHIENHPEFIQPEGRKGENFIPIEKRRVERSERLTNDGRLGNSRAWK